MQLEVREFLTRGGRKLSFTALGFGAAPLGNLLRALTEEESDAVLTAAWQSGLRYFDTAPLYGYGLSEARLSRLLAQHARDRWTLSTKVGRLLEPCTREEAEPT